MTLEWQRYEAPLWVKGEGDRLTDALENLISNSAQAVGGSGRVRVSLAGDGGSSRLAVEDDGPGVDPLEAGRIFVCPNPKSYQGWRR